jgi:hypothetical protein
LARFDRHVVWLKGDEEQTYVLIDDVVTTGGEAREFGWLLHAPMRMEIEAGSRRVDVRGVRGQARATFLTPMDLQFTQTSGFEHVPKEEGRADGAVFPDQWHLTAMTTGRSAEQRFVTVIQVMRIGSDYPALESLVDGVSAAGWRVRLPEGARRVVVEKAETRIETP